MSDPTKGYTPAERHHDEMLRKRREKALSSTQYYEKYFGRRSRSSKVDKTIDRIIGKEPQYVGKKSPKIVLKDSPRKRIVVKKSGR
jgi:hypothetical protein